MKNVKSKTIFREIINTKEISTSRKVFLLILGFVIVLGFFSSLYCTIFSIQNYSRVIPAYIVLCIATIISFLFIIYYCFRGFRQSGKIFLVPIISVLATTGVFMFLNFGYALFFCSYLLCGDFFLLAFLFSKNIKVSVVFFLLALITSLAISIICSFLIPLWYEDVSVIALISIYGFQWLLPLLILSVMVCVIDNYQRNIARSTQFRDC